MSSEVGEVSLGFPILRRTQPFVVLHGPMFDLSRSLQLHPPLEVLSGEELNLLTRFGHFDDGRHELRQEAR